MSDGKKYAYLDHPVSPAVKKRYMDDGYTILDAKFEPPRPKTGPKPKSAPVKASKKAKK